ncbi:DUF3096 domain-containing protein [Candidatus Pacearchaeota archaeon]|nr:DUF3096 domain-containing protein [Candidatus Pacearchaeota archaeon]
MTKNRTDKNKLWAIISIILGIIIIAVPQILAWAIGLYLIITAIISLSEKNRL